MEDKSERDTELNDQLVKSVNLARAGDQDAISDLMRATQSRLYFKAKGFAHNDADAQEILQRTYIKAFRHLDSLEDSAKFMPWISAIVTNEALSFVREAANQYNVDFTDLNDDENGLVFDTADERIDSQPEMAYSAKQKAEMVQEILSQLPDDQRIAVMMYFYDQKTTREIAEELSCKEVTVKARIRYAKEKIRDAVLNLEKKEGIKLYGLSPLTFFLYLMKSQKIAPAVIASSAAAAVTDTVAAIAAENAGAASASASAVSAGTTSAAASEAAAAAAPTAAAAKAEAGIAAKSLWISTAAGRITIAAAVAISGTYAAYRAGIIPTFNAAGSKEAEASAAASSQEAAMQDTDPPAIAVSQQSYEITIGDALPDFTQGATAYDSYEKKSVDVTASGTCDNYLAGSCSMEYVASDSSGNVTTVPFTVQVDPLPTPTPMVFAESTAAASDGKKEMPKDMNFDTSNPMVAEAISLVGRSDLLCDDVVSLCLQAGGKDYYGPYTCVGCKDTDTLQIGDVIVFHSTQNFGFGSEHNKIYGYHVVMYIGDDKCINGNIDGTTKITACSSARAEWIEIHRY